MCTVNFGHRTSQYRVALPQFIHHFKIFHAIISGNGTSWQMSCRVSRLWEGSVLWCTSSVHCITSVYFCSKVDLHSTHQYLESFFLRLRPMSVVPIIVVYFCLKCPHRYGCKFFQTCGKFFKECFDNSSSPLKSLISLLPCHSNTPLRPTDGLFT